MELYFDWQGVQDGNCHFMSRGVYVGESRELFIVKDTSKCRVRVAHDKKVRLYEQPGFAGTSTTIFAD